MEAYLVARPCSECVNNCKVEAHKSVHDVFRVIHCKKGFKKGGK
jgi:hypothetical protein